MKAKIKKGTKELKDMKQAKKNAITVIKKAKRFALISTEKNGQGNFLAGGVRLSHLVEFSIIFRRKVVEIIGRNK